MENLKVNLEGISLHVKDVEKSLSFYQKIPGAKVIVHQQGHFAQVQIGKNPINLVRLDIQPGFHIEFEVEDVDKIYEYLRDIDFKLDSKPEDKPWGERIFSLKDPDGNILEFEKKI